MGVNTIKKQTTKIKRAVFLDRDGTINRALVRNGLPYPPKNLTELEILPGVRTALSRLREAGFMLIVVTNQPDVARGKIKQQAVEELHFALKEKLKIDEFRTCYHDDFNRCRCRKPQPGALLDAAEDHGIALESSYMVGDRWRDVEAGQAAGCRNIFIDYRYKEKKPPPPFVAVNSLTEAVNIILEGEDAINK